MTQLDDLLNEWKKNKNAESLIESGIVIDQKAIQAGLDKKNDKEKTEALEILSDISSALTLYIADTENLKQDTKEQIDTNLKSSKACLKYGLTTDIEKRGKNKD